MTALSGSNLISHLKLAGPIIQAPLGGGPSTPSLAAAVCNAGGLGFVAGAYLSPSQLKRAIAETRALTSRPFGINLFAPLPTPKVLAPQMNRALGATRGFRQALDLPDPELKPPFHDAFDLQMAEVLEARPAVFSFVFGLLEPALLRECRTRGILTIGTATQLSEGLSLVEAGVDAVIAQGVEAGGHRGTFSSGHDADPRIGTLALTRLLAARLPVPVIASGGIMDGQGISATLKLGAQAAQLGTAFLACEEAGTAAAYRSALLSPGAKTTRLTRAFSGRWARGIENRFMREMESREDSILEFPAQNAFTRDIRRRAAELGNPDFLSLWAGKGIDLIRSLKAPDLVVALLRESKI